MVLGVAPALPSSRGACRSLFFADFARFFGVFPTVVRPRARLMVVAERRRQLRGFRRVLGSICSRQRRLVVDARSRVGGMERRADKAPSGPPRSPGRTSQAQLAEVPPHPVDIHRAPRPRSPARSWSSGTGQPSSSASSASSATSRTSSTVSTGRGAHGLAAAAAREGRPTRGDEPFAKVNQDVVTDVTPAQRGLCYPIPSADR